MKIATLGHWIGKTLGAAGIALALFGLPPLSLAAHAASSQPGGMVFGSVDLDKILAGFSKKAALDQQVQDLNGRLNAQFNQQQGYDMLSKAQQTQLTSLLSKGTLTDSDRAAVTALQQQSTKDAQELTALQQKANPAAADTARLQALTQQHQAGQQALQEVADGYRAQVSAEQQRLSTQLSDSVRMAIVAVAKERGLNMVFTSQVALYSTNDITDEVLKRLNSGK